MHAELARLSEAKVNRDKEKLERMMQYGQSAMCRWRLLHDYFGEEMETSVAETAITVFIRWRSKSPCRSRSVQLRSCELELTISRDVLS